LSKQKAIISACIFGFPFRYDGRDEKREDILKSLSKKYDLIPICPEILSGLSVKRPPCSRKEDKILENISGIDKTHFFMRGANRILKIVQGLGVKKAFLKEKSPSCGVNKVYFFVEKNKTELREGRGILTEILIKEGVEVEGIE
jgi:uncharacterized protein YbbK (DUF523 family)